MIDCLCARSMSFIGCEVGGSNPLKVKSKYLDEFSCGVLPVHSYAQGICVSAHKNIDKSHQHLPQCTYHIDKSRQRGPLYMYRQTHLQTEHMSHCTDRVRGHRGLLQGKHWHHALSYVMLTHITHKILYKCVDVMKWGKVELCTCNEM